MPRAIAAALLAAALGGCASACGDARPRGWLSGWGSSAGDSAFTVGLRREWSACDARAAGSTGAPRPLPAPSADPASEVGPGPLPPPR
jgi:hypothetical protein